ncbi:MAG: PQQ-dependent dehydrogenase, methanol/ethanol family [Acidobacteriia bacterium]|nr:PQQ-dependent dehydrogenase, methanol/ethanol family [Terriglobia bacterium]
MQRKLKIVTPWFTAAAAAGLMVSLASAQPPAAAVTPQVLINAAGNGDEWLTYGHDYAETHFSPLNQINNKNVKRLSLAWSVPTEAPQGTVEATPLMHNGVLYGILPWDVMFAVDARTGQTKWRWDPDVPRAHIQGLCCGPVNRGVALYNGRVYAGLLDGRVVALDQETGKLLWSTQDTVPGGDTILTSAVRVVKGKVIVGSSGAEQAVRGYFSAYDAETGKRTWRFYTVPGDPSKPSEHPELEAAAKTWTGEWWKWGGGGTVWDAMAYDPAADLLYIGTGNGGPWNQNIRSPKGGDNLYLASILAVKPDTGRMVWYFQENPGETWDFTATQPFILADLKIDGRDRKVLMHAPKNGYFYVLDRITGEFLSGKPFVRRMTWSKGLDKNGRPIEAAGARYTTNSIKIWPGAAGAHNWQPMSYSPLTKLVYLPGNEASTTYVPTPADQFQFTPGRPSTGVAFGGAGPIPETDIAATQPEVTGRFLVAWDPVQQKERWRHLFEPGAPGGGTLATAGGLVFMGNSAYDAETGEKLWEEPQLGDRPVNWISYMLDGKQYFAILARSSPNNRLFTFTLDGGATMPPVPPPAAAPARGRGAAGPAN